MVTGCVLTVVEVGIYSEGVGMGMGGGRKLRTGVIANSSLFMIRSGLLGLVDKE